MPEDNTEARRSYSMKMIELWGACIDFSHEAQKYFLRGEAENDVTLEYVARLTRLWKEFKPKVKNRSELAELVTEYMTFEEYCMDPRRLLTEPEKLNELEGVLCNVLDKLGLTKLENLR